MTPQDKLNSTPKNIRTLISKISAKAGVPKAEVYVGLKDAIQRHPVKNKNW